MVKAKKGCPVTNCMFSEVLSEWEKPNPKNNVLTSTRSHASIDAHRDFDDFDIDEELARLRKALRSRKHSPQAIKLIFEAISNIDEHLTRGGELPKAWKLCDLRWKKL